MLRSVASRVAAGFVVPVLAMLFHLVAKSVFLHDVAALKFMFVDNILAAAFFGAPLAIPVALFLPLRNVWSCVPLIAIAAAAGIDAQFEISIRFPEDSVAQLFLMIVYIVPMIFGTVTVLLLRWRPRVSVAAVPLAIFLVAGLWIAGALQGNSAAAAHPAAQKWIVLRVGMPVYTANYDGGQSVCSTLSAYFDSHKINQPCKAVAKATPAIVEEIVPCKASEPDPGDGSPAVRIRARDGSWDGFTDSGSLQPQIPTGTVLDLMRDWGAPLSIVDDRGVAKSIGAIAAVRLLRYDPKRDLTLYVEVLDGEYRGLRGWTSIYGVSIGEAAPGQYVLVFPNGACI